MMYCYGREEKVIDEYTVHYYLEDRVWVVPEGRSEEVITDRRRIFCVRFNKATKDVNCDCCKFETFGILCKHCIRVLDQNLVFDIPEKYILERWRKDMVRRHMRVKVAYHDPSHTMEVQRFNRIMNEFEPICDEASMVDDDTVHMVLSCLSKLKLDVAVRRKNFVEKTGVLTLPSTQYPNSGKGSTSKGLTPSSVTKRTPRDVSTVGGEDMGCLADDVGGQGASEAVVELSPHLLDPITKKRPRGRPKGSRNKPYSETGYKATKKTKGKDVQATDDTDDADMDIDMDMDIPLRDVLPRHSAPKVVPAKVVPAKVVSVKRKPKSVTRMNTRGKAKAVKLATCHEDEEECVDGASDSIIF